jgi:hypothetical protein
MNKKLLTLSAVALSSALVLGGVMYGGKVLAQTGSSIHDTFVSTLAGKLGVSETKLETALTETRTVVHEQREVEREAAIATALKDKKITQREADILNAMHEIREETRESRMEGGNRGQRKGMVNMLEDLNKKGLKVTQEELDNLHEKMIDLNLGMGGKRGRGMGMGI